MIRALEPVLVYSAEPAALKTDLERNAKALRDYSLALVKTAQPLPDNARANVLAFDNVTRVAMQLGDVLTLQLPQPDTKNGNRQILIKRETLVGTCVIKAVGCLLNGHASQTLPAEPGVYAIFFDSANYYSLRPLAVDWSGT